MAVKFDVVESSDVERFKEAVNQMLEDGWQLHGKMKAYPYRVNDPNGILYIQALVRDEAKGYGQKGKLA